MISNQNPLHTSNLKESEECLFCFEPVVDFQPYAYSLRSCACELNQHRPCMDSWILANQENTFSKCPICRSPMKLMVQGMTILIVPPDAFQSRRPPRRMIVPQTQRSLCEQTCRENESLLRNLFFTVCTLSFIFTILILIITRRLA